MKKGIFFITLILLNTYSFSQFNKVRESDILYKKKIVRSLNMKEPVNQNLFGRDNKLVEVLLDAFKKGEIRAYKSEDLNEEICVEDYNNKFETNNEGDELYEYTPNQLYLVEIGENLIFDRHRSEIVFDMETITILVPEQISQRGLLEPLLSFSFDDCIKVFKNDKRSLSVNPLMNGRNINYSEVFLLRLFRSDIVKIGNNSYFDQMYSDPMQAFIARKNAENNLSEYLYKLYNPK